jgi:hypothetical protein
MSSVVLTDIIQTVLETSKCLLSNTNTNKHILDTGTEEQAIYSGHLWAPFIQATQYCPCSHKPTLTDTLDPLQFAYHRNRTTDDQTAITLHTALSHQDKRNTYSM